MDFGKMEQAGEIAARVAPSLVATSVSTETENQITSLNKPSPECNACCDSGFIPCVATDKKNRFRSCPCRIEKCIRAALPERFFEARVSDFSRITSDLVNDWLLKPTDGLFLTGAAGTGKTHLAAGIARVLFEKGEKIKFSRAADFYASLRASYKRQDGDGSSNELDILGHHIKPKFLIIDDVGAGGLSDHERRFTLELLDKRLNECKPTIVTSNWSIEDMAAKMDQRIASRIGGFSVLAFSGRDRRIE